MPQILIHKADMPVCAAVSPYFLKAQDLLASIQERAYERYEGRCRAPGDPCDDWVRAERDLFFIPNVEVRETKENFTAKLTIGSYEPRQIDILTSPDAIVVWAKSRRTPPENEKGAASDNCSPASKCLYRRFELGRPIDEDSVKASLEKDMLTVQARKIAPAKTTIAARAGKRPIAAIARIPPAA